MTFGPGCYDVEVAQFTPICDHPEIPPSTAKTFEVPLPSFVPPTPPNECVCFSFKESKADISTKCDASACKCSVEIKQLDEDCCTGRYDVIPHIEVPCLPFTIKPAVATVTTGTLGQIGATLTFEKGCLDCSIIPKLDIVVPAPIAASSCYMIRGTGYNDSMTASAEKKKKRTAQTAAVGDATKFGLKVLYKGANGEQQEATTNFNVNETRVGECNCFNFSNAAIDLTGIGVSFSNGGDVNAVKDGKLRINPDKDDDTSKTWYGGGYGDDPKPQEGDDPGSTYCRGRVMRGNAASMVGARIPTSSVGDMLVRENAEGGAISPTDVWTSRRYHTDAEGDIVETYNEAYGDINIVWPTGFQWHARGIAATLTAFEYNSSGSLSFVQNMQEAVLLAPAPAAVKHTASGADPYYNASGLVVAQDDASSVATSGLQVYVGSGLRVRGIDVRTPGWGASWDYTKDDQGQLEIDFGRGFHVVSGCAETPAGQTPYANHKLELNAEERDFTFIADSVSEIDKAKLVIDDKSAKDKYTISTVGDGNVIIIHPSENTPVTRWDRLMGKSLIVRVMSDYSGDPAKPRFTYLRFLSNGVLLGAYAAANGNNVIDALQDSLGWDALTWESKSKNYVNACGTAST